MCFWFTLGSEQSVLKLGFHSALSTFPHGEFCNAWCSSKLRNVHKPNQADLLPTNVARQWSIVGVFKWSEIVIKSFPMPDYVLIFKNQLYNLHSPINFVSCYFLLFCFFLFFTWWKPILIADVLLPANAVVPGSCWCFFGCRLLMCNMEKTINL